MIKRFPFYSSFWIEVVLEGIENEGVFWFLSDVSINRFKIIYPSTGV